MPDAIRYRPEDARVATRFAGIRTFMKLPWVTGDLTGADFAVIGAPCDGGTTFRSGAAFGPSAIREMSVMLRSGNLNLDVDIFRYLSGVDRGDAEVNPCDLRDSHRGIERAFDDAVRQGVLTIGLGGDHSVTLPQLRAVARRHGPVALVQFDAHLDTYDTENGSGLTHGTIFRRAVEEGLLDAKRSIQVGARGLFGTGAIRESEELGFTVIPAKDVHERGIEWTAGRILETVGDRKVHLTVDIDFFDPAFAPGTGTPEVGGFSSWEGLKLLRSVGGLDFVGFDVVEVLPSHDPTQITAYLAGCVVQEFLAVLAAKRRAGKEADRG